MQIEEIYDHYRELVANNVGPDDYVLKTDAYNEMEGGYKDIFLDPRKTTYVEIDPATVQAARARHPDKYIIQGDIRELTSSDCIFDVVLDLSTIDHIPPEDVPVAIAEYNRVLKRKGKLILVAWCCDEWRDEPEDWGGPQYFIHTPYLVETLTTADFRIYEQAEIYRDNTLSLVEFICAKEW